MGRSFIRQSAHEQFRLWGTRDEPITSAVRALRGPGQQLRLRVNTHAPTHQLVSVETMHGDVIGFIPRPDAQRIANRLGSGEFACVTLIRASDARVRPVPVIEVKFAADQSSLTELNDKSPIANAPRATDNQLQSPVRTAGPGRGCLVFVISLLPALITSGAIKLAKSLATNQHE